MGADIYGWVETREPDSEWWDAAIRIHDIVYRQYGIFSSLFGVRNWGDEGAEAGRFRAIAALRGTPPKASEQYQDELDNYGGAVGETWVLWRELKQVDWEEEGGEYIDEEGPVRYVHAEPGPGRRRERRGDYLNGGWAVLFQMMELLGEQFGADCVRLSVWFDMW